MGAKTDEGSSQIFVDSRSICSDFYSLMFAEEALTVINAPLQNGVFREDCRTLFVVYVVQVNNVVL